jgi:subtilisin family serine protease
MRRADTESGLLGFCRKLSRDVLQFADPLRGVSSGKLARMKNVLSRSLQIEPLEVRNCMSGTSVAPQIDPVWFQDVSNSTLSHAGVASWTTEGVSTATQHPAVGTTTSNTYDWIVQFGTQYVAGMTDISQTVSLLAGSGIQFEAICGLGIVGQVLVRSTGASLDTVENWLSADKEVAAFEEDSLRQIESTPNDSSVSQLWGMSKIDAYNAWNISTGSTGAGSVVVAVIDTGVDYTHRDLAANIWTNPNAGRDGFGYDLHGYDFANNDSDPMDDNGHGTHVAGTIGAVGNNGTGVAGVNWAVSLMPLKFMTASGSGYMSDAVRAINYATMERSVYGVNVRVINASWGGGGYSAAMQTAIQAAGNAGIMFVVAAGNDHANNDTTPHYPSSYTNSNIIAVAATDQNDRLASFSCYGATSVDLAAPGVSIYSTLPGNRYGSLSGTSMATPFVAGAAALAWSINPNATVADIRNALLQGVDHLSALSGKVASGGRLDLLSTLKLVGGNSSTMPTIGSLAPTSNNVPAGTSLDLVATGAAAPAGVQAVYFYADLNNNGVWDSTDFGIGADYTVVGGVGTIHFLNTNWEPGTYRFFARTLDNNYKFSNAVTTTITISATGMSSFTMSAGSVTQGTSVSLIAQGVPTGSSGVYFYYDSNNDGVYQTTDASIGSATNAGGTATLTLNTSSMSPGTYRFFARSLGADNKFSQALSQTLTVSAANTPDSDSGPTTIAAGATLAGKLATGGKEGWYQFQAVAGTKYTIRTELVTLRDSMLTLYASDGKTVLASNDDGDSGLASRIDWTATKTGTYYFKVSAFDKTLTGNFRVSLMAAPVKSLSMNAANLGGMTVFSGRWESESFAAVSSVHMGSTIDVASPLSRTRTATSSTSQLNRAHEISLLDRHPDLRSSLGSMFFNEEQNAIESAESIEHDLDAIDALFAQLGEGDFEGNS